MSMHELKQMAPPVLSEMEGQPIYRDKDDLYLTRMGKRPVLKTLRGVDLVAKVRALPTDCFCNPFKSILPPLHQRALNRLLT
ncbi:hypothetical protein AFCA_002183 [Aspergillus flavus]|nr:hypothetical protein AFCA_002183 [Aspergillus flavus]